MARLIILLFTLLVFGAGCGSDSEPSDSTPVDSAAEATTDAGSGGFAFSTDAFGEGEEIPVRLTCDGDDFSPRLFWTGLPDDTAELALIADDPDAGGFVHWVVYGIPVTAREFAESETLDGVSEGLTDFGRTGYGGPCPPPGDGPHRYDFTLYALDAPTNLDEGASAADLRAAIEGTTIETAAFSGTYER